MDDQVGFFFMPSACERWIMLFSLAYTAESNFSFFRNYSFFEIVFFSTYYYDASIDMSIRLSVSRGVFSKLTELSEGITSSVKMTP